jgi:hypothetical protein
VEEFPDYRFLDNLAEVQAAKAARPTCGQVFDAYLAHCEMRVAMHDMAFSTCQSYRRLLDAVWRPQIGTEAFEDVRYSCLAGIVAAHTRNKKTYNNVVSAVRCAFDFGYKDHPEKHKRGSGDPPLPPGAGSAPAPIRVARTTGPRWRAFPRLPVLHRGRFADP